MKNQTKNETHILFGKPARAYLSPLKTSNLIGGTPTQENNFLYQNLKMLIMLVITRSRVFIV